MYEKEEDRRKRHNPKRKDTLRDSFCIQYTLYKTTLRPKFFFNKDMHLESLSVRCLGFLISVHPDRSLFSRVVMYDEINILQCHYASFDKGKVQVREYMSEVVPKILIPHG